MCFPHEAALLRGYRSAYADLFAQLPATTRLTVLVHPRASDVLRDLLTRSGRDATATVVAVPEDLRFTVWAQDPFLAFQDDGAATCFVTPYFFDRSEDGRVPALVAAAAGLPAVPSSLCFHGGYVLVGDDFILVGKACRDATLQVRSTDGKRSDADATDDIGALFRDLLDPGRRVLFVGTDLPLPSQRTRPIVVDGRNVLELLPGGGDSPHPLGHLDMYIALAGRGPSGRYRLLVGSPALADRILARPPSPHALDGHFDDVAAQLVDRGFDVVRNPMPLTYADGRRVVDGELRDVRLWYFATANNCLVEIDAVGRGQVWLPTYGHGGWKELAITDAANRRTWEELGFAVHELTSFHPFVQRFGALHCIVKELERGPTVTGPAADWTGSSTAPCAP